jgi:flagellar biosynthesis protein FliP
MGTTISDWNKHRYNEYRKKGLSHNEALSKIPEQLRDQFTKDVDKTAIKNHYGIKTKWFLWLLIGWIVALIIIIILGI